MHCFTLLKFEHFVIWRQLDCLFNSSTRMTSKKNMKAPHYGHSRIIYSVRVVLICCDVGRVYTRRFQSSWWRHQMETFSASLGVGAGNSPVTGEFPTQRPVARSFAVLFICSWINGWVNNGEAGDLRRHRAHYDGIIMTYQRTNPVPFVNPSKHQWNGISSFWNKNVVIGRSESYQNDNFCFSQWRKSMKLSVHPVTKISSKWHFRFSDLPVYKRIHVACMCLCLRARNITLLIVNQITN